MNYVPISECVKSIHTWNPHKSSDNTPFQYIDLSSVDRVTKSISETSETFPAEAPSRARQLVAIHDVLVSTVRPNLNGVAVVPERLDGATASTGFCVLRSKENKLDHRYLFNWVKAPQFIQEMVKRSTGANYPAVSDKTVKSSKIPLPPLAEQKRIAAILDKADSIRRKRQDAIELADTFLRSVFLKLFGDPVTNPMGWDKRPFSELVPIVETGWSPNCESYPAKVGEVGVLKLGAITSCSFLSHENKLLPSHTANVKDRFVAHGDVLFSRKNTRELVAACAIVKDVYTDLIFSDLMFRLIPDESAIGKIFLWGVMTNQRMRKEIQSLADGAAGSMPNISKRRLSSVTLPVPPIEKQNYFNQVYNWFEATFAKAKASLSISNNLFTSLQQRAFRGDL